MKFGVIALLASLLPIAAFSAAPDHLALPGNYDNATGGYGQLFTAEATTVAGLSLYIGDPSRPGDPQVNALEGAASMVLFEATNLLSPVEIARVLVQSGAQSSFGLRTFYFNSVAHTVPGATYFIAIETSDSFGLGLRQQLFSTYSGGFEARLNSLGAIEPAGGGLPGSPLYDPTAAQRDMSFAIQTAIPEPGSAVLLLVGLAGLCSITRRHGSGDA